MDSEHGKGSERMLESARHLFGHIFWSLWKEINLKVSVLAVSELLTHFLNILTPDDKYSLSVKASV